MIAASVVSANRMVKVILKVSPARITEMRAMHPAINPPASAALPLSRCDGKPANPVELFGEMLEAAGYAKYGHETLISGVTGEEMACDIYMGVVYYQRLRHMVSDKFQVSRWGVL
jgi:DNA-directed RNA polymerase I subunit RPA2